MRPILCLMTALPLLSACVPEQTAPNTPRSTLETACAAAIAAHVNRPVAEVMPRWLSATNGIATVETLDGNRRHLCSLDASGRVIGYSHPRD